MTNMSYCRFRNTVPDLQDCLHNLDDMELKSKNPEEAKARKQLIKLCREVVEIAEDFNLEG